MSLRSLRVNSDAELLSYIINVTPELSAEIDLPTQGESIKPIGKLIVSNERLKNAFINTVNLIGLTIIDRNEWEDPWETFTNSGTIQFGDSVRELAVDIADVFDYNEYCNNATHFLANVVPNIYNYIHELNYQKFYKTTTSDDQIAMAFNTEGGLMDLIEKVVGSNWEGYKYDKYIVAKYMLCRRILDGTMTAVEIDNYGSLTARQRVSKMKSISNKMTFRSANYNPAGLRIATAFGNQIMILDTDSEAEITTEVLATSFFRNEADFKTNLALIDGYGNHDEARLLELLGDTYIPFTETEKTALGNVPAVIIDRDFFKIYNYAFDANGEGVRSTSFYNPETLRNNHWLHTWKVLSTSPFKQGVVFTKDVTPAIASVAVSPSTATVNVGQSIVLKAEVTTTGFANKAVTWAVTADPTTGTAKVEVNALTGEVKVPASYVPAQGVVKVKATSVFDTTKGAEAQLTIVGQAVES